MNIMALWGKKTANEITPLVVHLEKTVNVAEYLFNNYLPESIKSQIEKNILLFLAYTHDIGKACPAFQYKRAFNMEETDTKIAITLERAGLNQVDYLHKANINHALVSHKILKNNGLPDTLNVIVGGHHGRPPTKIELNNLPLNAAGFTSPEWKNAQSILFNKALEVANIKPEKLINCKIESYTQVLYSGIIILADWLASAEGNIKLPTKWQINPPQDIYKTRFNIETPHIIQQEIISAVNNTTSPGLFIIEAPMGQGKTEAALVAAELLASKKNCRGIYFALPSQATSNAMLSRTLNWLETFTDQSGSLSIRLSHGKAELNDQYQGLINNYNDDNAVEVNTWLIGRKKGILADFTIGTIDHVLMMTLKQKHLALRHLGLASKVIIIDECHAYDIYMESYLLKALEWLGTYGVPVIILSATLPINRRNALLQAYQNDYTLQKNTSINYPLITYTDANILKTIKIPPAIKSTNVKIIKTETWLEDLQKLTIDGGCVGLIFNTVKKAQEAYRQACLVFNSSLVELHHSSFLACDRTAKEKALVAKLGKGEKMRPNTAIVIGTQVFEQSLDIDFDLLFTQLCPMDLLLQRIGRLHRHNRKNRPQNLQLPTCYVLDASTDDLDNGSVAVYSEYLLKRTQINLPEIMRFPEDIPALVASVYNDEDKPIYKQAYEKHLADNMAKQSKAKAFQISHNPKSRNLINWLDTTVGDNGNTDARAEATVRDATSSLEVLVIQESQDELYLLPWVTKEGLEKKLPPLGTLLSDLQAKAIAKCSVKLPSVFNYNINSVIEEIETQMIKRNLHIDYYQSPWLNGQLILILDHNQNTTLTGIMLHYSQYEGFM